MKHIGLFEGIGGFSLAAEWAGWETIAWCEINPFCQKVLGYHFPKANKHHDIKITDFTIYRGQCDILTGGFPCQPYSLAGKRKGKEDDRHLWPEMLRAVREIQPPWIVGENVFGIVNWDGGVVFNEVQTDLEAEGYEVQPYILPAVSVNAPHRRDRIWFVAHSKSARTRSDIGGIRSVSERCDTWQEDDAFTTDSSSKGLQKPTCREQSEISESAETQQRGKLNRTFTKIAGWENFPTQPPICGRNDGISGELDGITFSKWRNESIKAYGNAIVPQVAYQIFKSINDMTNNSLNCSTIQLAK